jgi:hypothetical protein
MSHSRRYDFSVDYKDISERIALLTQEIRDLQRMQWMDRASREQRELRLKQITEELSRMMLKPTQREQ